MSSCTHNRQGGKPKWLRRSLPSGPQYEQLRRLLKGHALTTVCQEAMCPNQFECYGQGTATFMILGERCTRDCGFCAVRHSPSGPPDPQEPERVAEAVALLDLRYAVVTSVTRDDLGDGGASLFAATITAIKKRSPATLVEVLIPDFLGDESSLSAVLKAAPDVLNHNIETVARLYPRVRPQADYHRSLELLARVKKVSPHLPAKSGMMLGLGERVEELGQTWQDLRSAGCDILTMGQYLQPSHNHLPVERFVPPEEFVALAKEAQALGFAGVAAGPFVRSSYQAESLYLQARRSIEEGGGAA
jgi:lipoic acid synthetase